MNRPLALIVDDEPDILRVLSMSLRADGYEVVAAENGSEGLAAFEKEKPDIVITDIKMPGMDGFEVLDRIKGQSPATEVIVITGHGDMELAIRSLKNDATDFITKPVDLADLLRETADGGSSCWKTRALTS